MHEAEKMSEAYCQKHDCCMQKDPENRVFAFLFKSIEVVRRCLIYIVVEPI